MSGIRFLHPWALALVPVLVGLWALRRRRFAGPLALGASLLLALALARPQVAGRILRLERVYLLDVSGSTFLDLPAALDGIRRSTAGMRPDDRAALVVFASEPRVALPTAPVASIPARLELPPSLPERDGTDIAGALRLAARQFNARPAARQLVLLSDGRQTRGRAELEAATVAAAGARLFVLPVGPRSVADARITRVAAPRTVRLGESFALTVELAASAGLAANLSIQRDGKPFGDPLHLELERDVPRRVSVTDRAAEPGLHVYAARLSVADRCAENNQWRTAVVVEGPTRLVLLSPTDTALLKLLRTIEGLQVSRLAPAASEIGPALAGADCLVVEGVAAEQLPQAVQESIRDWVSSGGGLVTIGGPRSYGPGGYAGSPLEDAMAVRCVRPRKVALVVLLDRSGSMAEEFEGREKISFAREAAIRAAAALRTKDSFSLLAFSGSVERVIPLGPPPKPEVLAASLDRLAPHGPTELQAGLERALEVASGASAEVRHVIAITDGQTRRLDVEELRSRYQKAGVGLSALMTGRDPKAIGRMEKLATSTFRHVRDLARLPDILLEVLRQDIHGKFIHEGAARVRGTGDAALVRGVRLADTINGYVETAPKERATTELVVGDRAAPLLAHWNYGLGRAVAFTSTLGTAWDSDFWGQGARSLWERAVRWAARPARVPGLEGQLDQRGNQWVLAVRAEREGKLLNGLDLVARVDPPSGEPFDIPLSQTAPGEYQTAFRPAGQGICRLTIFQKAGGQVLTLAAASNYSREWAAFGVDGASLGEIARSGRGRLLPDLAALNALRPPRATDWRDVAWLPVSLALALFVAGVATSLVRSRKLRL